MKLIKWLFVQFFLLVFTLIAIEYFLRSKGFEPGNIQPAWSNFKTVDSLVEIPHFVSDSNGVLVANPLFFAGINNWGFRFDKSKIQLPNRKKVMLIGDSFTWGLSAIPQDSCFADLLNRNQRLNILNFGIPIADPLQYKTIAYLYIDSVMPDEVVVVFYTGNDVMLHDRNIKRQPFYYYTNAGALLAVDGDKFLPSAKAAYEYYAFEKYRLTKPSNFVEKIALKSALVSRLLAVCSQWKKKREKEVAIKTMNISKKYLYEIAALCDKRNLNYSIVLIPEYKELSWFREPFNSKYKALLRDEKIGKHCWVPKLSVDMYNPYPDAHFNNKGHRAFADFLEKILLQP